MKIKILLSITLALIILSACAASPKWIKNPRALPENKDMIVGIGTGKSYQEALANAHTDLAQQLSVKVESITELKSANLESGGKEFYSESIEKTYKATVDQFIKGVVVSRQEEKKGKHWVMVTLNKTRMLSALRSELDELNNATEQLYKDAIAMANAGKVLSAIQNLSRAQYYLSEFYAKKSFYDSFADLPYSVVGEINLSTMDSTIQNIISAISFKVISGDLQTAAKGAQLPEPVIFGAFYRNPASVEIALSGFPVKLSYGDGKLIEKGNTDKDGTYKISVTAIPQSGDKGKVLIRSDAFMLPAYFGKKAEDARAEVLFSTTVGDVLICQVIIKDDKGNRLERVEKNIGRILEKNGLLVSESADLIMHGLVYVSESRMVEGMAAPQQLVKVNLELQFALASSKEVLFAISGSGQGMSDKGEKDASYRAYESININSRELIQKMNTAKEQLAAALQRAEKKSQK